jgi:uncharacterized phage infection (PIP) family protein YhgE
MDISELGGKIDALLSRVDTLEKNHNDLRVALLTAHKHSVASFGKIDSNFQNVTTGIDSIDAKVEILTKAHKEGLDGVEHGLNNLGTKVDELKGEVMKIEKVSNYTDEYENLLRIAK